MTPQKVVGQRSPRWAFMQPMDIYAKDDSGAVYLHRLRLVQTPLFAVFLHDINLPDTDRHPHDHPWVFWSVVLRGGYTERLWRVSPGKYKADWVTGTKTWRRFTVHKMPQTEAHMIDTIKPGTKTLIFAGRRNKDWGFYTETGYVPWRAYVGEEQT